MEREEACQRLEATYAQVRRFAAAVGPPDVDPDDLVQEAFVRALQRGLGEIDDLVAYLRRTVVNLSASSRRSWTVRQAALVRLGPVDITEEIMSPLVSDLYRLAPEVRAPLWLAEVEGWSYAEIGQMLGCTEDAARARASRGRRKLRLELAQEAER